MGASERLSLLIESRTTGEAEVAKLEQSINRVISAAERMNKPKAAGGADFSKQFGDIKSAIADPLNAAGAAAENFILRYGKVGLAVGGVAVAAGAGAKGLFELVAAQGKAAESTVNLADRLGIAIGRAEQLTAAAKIAGVGVEVLDAAARAIGAALEDSSGAGEKTAKALDRLGVSTISAAGGQREMGSVLLDVLEALSKVTSDSERTLLAQQTLGRGGAVGLQPLIKAYRDLNADVAGLGVGLDENLTKRLSGLDDQIDKLEIAWEQFKKSLAGKIEPIIVPIVFAATKLTSDKNAADALSRLGLAGLGPLGAAFDIGGQLNRFAESTGLGVAPAARSGTDVAGSFLDQIDVNARKRAAGAFRTQFSGTQDGLQQRLVSVKRRIEELERELSSNATPLNARPGLQAEFRQLTGERGTIEARLKAITDAEKLGIFQAGSLIPDIVRRGAPSLLNLGERTRNQLPPEIQALMSELGIQQLGSGRLVGFGPGAETLPVRGKAQGQLLSALASGNAVDRKAELDSLERLTDFQARMVELLAGPGGEFAAIERIAELRRRSADEFLAMTGDQAEATRRRQDAEFEREVAIADQRKRIRDNNRENDGRIFDALVSGGAGLRSFASGLFLSSGRTIFQNTNELFRTGLSDRLRLPGQQNAGGGLNLFGKILQGTPFGVDPSKIAVDANTAATVLNTSALAQLNGSLAITGGSGGASSVLGGFSSIFGGSKIGATGAASTSRVPIFNELGDIEGYLPASSATSGSKFGKGIGIAGAAAAGFFGTKAGINQGGVRGGLTAAGSLSGAAGAILGLAGVSGPLAPILAGAGLGLGLISSLMPDPKKLRDDFISRTLDSSVYMSPKAQGIGLTRLGDGFDYNRYGEMRPIIVNINAMDSKSFLDRRNDIAEAVRGAIQEGHDVNSEIRGLSNAA